jgi:hypothetical protein
MSHAVFQAVMHTMLMGCGQPMSAVFTMIIEIMMPNFSKTKELDKRIEESSPWTVAWPSFHMSMGYHNGRSACEIGFTRIWAVHKPCRATSHVVFQAGLHATPMGHDQPMSSVFNMPIMIMMPSAHPQ